MLHDYPFAQDVTDCGRSTDLRAEQHGLRGGRLQTVSAPTRQVMIDVHGGSGVGGGGLHDTAPEEVAAQRHSL
jgi:hypothetical protein